MKKRKAPIYAFFAADPEIEFGVNGTAEYLVYACTNCGEKKRQGLKTQDKGSTGQSQQHDPTQHTDTDRKTGNMSQHAKKCWGEEAVAAVKSSTLDKAQAAIKKFGKKSQSKLTAALRTCKGWADSFSTRPPEKETTR